MLKSEQFAREYLNVNRDLTALDYFEVWQQLTPAQRQELELLCESDRPEQAFVNAVCANGPFELPE